MSRRRQAGKRELAPDPQFQSELVTKFINMLMGQGKRSLAQGIVYGAFSKVSEKTQNPNALEVFTKAVENVRPKLEVRSRRVGGANYQVPVEVSHDRQITMALRWIIDYSAAKKGRPMKVSLADEIVAAASGQGDSVKKRDDTHMMAQANRAFAHYRW
jgi:small subunit ribosomal protein S7